MKAMTFYYTLKPTKDTRQRLKAQGLRDCTYQGWDWKDPIAKKKKEIFVAFLDCIAIYGNPIISTSDRSVVLCVTGLLFLT